MGVWFRQWLIVLFTWGCLVFVLVDVWGGETNLAIAAPFSTQLPLAKQPPLEVTISLGNEAGELKFIPNTLQFKAGKRYKLALKNPSPVKHYFTAKDFADGIWSQKVDAGNVEIKGAIHELELRAGTQADWVFVPARAGTYELRCTVPGHAEAGMVGKIEITG